VASSSATATPVTANDIIAIERVFSFIKFSSIAYSYLRHEFVRLEPHAFANLIPTKKQSQAYVQVFSLLFLGKNSRNHNLLKKITI
ncbi:MAG: hypothetical protein P1P93_05985, partial [Gammaproteobacteria bacterium]|nr:hypothetical protein [Gammaproteobacteria bacterium]